MSITKIKPFARHGNFIQIDNAIVDYVMPKIKAPCAMCILLVIIRKTYGWRKEDEYISTAELMKYTGIDSDNTVRKWCKKLAEFGVIEMEVFNNGVTSNNYKLNIDFEFEIAPDTPSKNEEVPPQKMSRSSSKNEEAPPQKMSRSINRSTNTILNTNTNTGECENNNLPEEIFNIESPLAKAIRELCGKRTLILSPKDQKDLQYVLKGLHHENVTIEQVQEFGKKVPYHWIGINTKTKKPKPPRIMQVLEFWYEVREMDISGATSQRNLSEKELDALAAQYA